ncbi:hypothetical protein E7Y31_07365 [Candidatus Frankia alpina]|uniref:Antitoxin VbhA domain-containing protein n=1 Tax=Candidatus Frankia alpina TaxID=2699483 RepID=A0A4V3Z7Q6_9ACTN|nr:hypothetical protein E7Y31_07365 [Candidatus Frankia alpina]
MNSRTNREQADRLVNTAARIRSTGDDFDSRLASAIEVQAVNVEHGREVDPFILNVTADRLRHLDG